MGNKNDEDSHSEFELDQDQGSSSDGISDADETDAKAMEGARVRKAAISKPKGKGRGRSKKDVALSHQVAAHVEKHAGNQQEVDTTEVVISVRRSSRRKTPTWKVLTSTGGTPVLLFSLFRPFL